MEAILSGFRSPFLVTLHFPLVIPPSWAILHALGGQMIAAGREPGRGKSEHHQAACRVECAGAPGESPARRKVSQKTYRPSRKSAGKGEKAG